MTSRLDLKEFLGAYIAEVDEHLTVANSRLLEVEAALSRGESEPRAVREVLRLLHTIKGLSAMVGVESVVTVAHQMESALRGAERGGAPLEKKTLEALFAGGSFIASQLRSLEGHGAEAEVPAELLARITATSSGGSAAPSAEGRLALDPAIDSKLQPFERDLLLKGAGEGRRALRLDFVPSPKRAENGLTINSVRERVGSVSDIVKVLPLSVPATPEAPGGLAFVLLLLTHAGDGDLAALAGVDAEAIRPLVEPADAIAAPVGPDAARAEDEPDPSSDGNPDLASAQETLGRSSIRVDVRKVDEAMERLASLVVIRWQLSLAVKALEATGANVRDLRAIVEENGRQLRELRASILNIRTIRVAELFARLPLVVRGVLRTEERQVRLSVDGGDGELDKSVAEHLFPALIHLVRNAVDHGIESPAERERLGKPREGTVRVSCTARSNRHLEIRVRDDGAGVDRSAVARKLGRAVPDGDDALLDALCVPGFSTRAEVTTSSGRGLGMEIVKRIVVDQLGGAFMLENHPGEGATFTLRVPLTVAIVDVFVVAQHNERFVVPVSTVEEIVDVGREHAPGRTEMQRAFTLMPWRGQAVPLVDLADVVGSSADAQGGAPVRERHAIIVRRGNEPIAVVMDRVVSQQEAVVRPLRDPLVQIPGVVGTTDLGDGRPTLVLELAALRIGAPSGGSKLLTAGRSAA